MYQADPGSLPDGQFAAGEPGWLVPGNEGRLLDARRTPVRVRYVDVSLGFFEIEILAFEDTGASWQMPLEDVTKFQFSKDGTRAEAASVAAMTAAIRALSHRVQIDADSVTGQQTRQRIAAERARADAWLTAAGAPEEIDPAPYVDSRRGMPAAYRWLADYLAEAPGGGPAARSGEAAWPGTGPGHAGLADMDSELAARYVSNPESGDLVLAHLIVMAELGLCSFLGRAVRDPATESGRWSKERRAAHIVVRSGFVQALWLRASRPGLMVYRGIGLQDGSAALADRGNALVSATLSRPVAESHFEADRAPAAALLRRQLPVERLFMTFLETAAMNERYLEAEALLFAGPGLL
jgi:hypothetical protein